MSDDFETYKRKIQLIKPEDNAYLMYLQNGNTWIFKGVVSKKVKEYIQSNEHIDELNKNFESEVILASFTKKEIKLSKKIYLFLPCTNADVVTCYPVFKK
jgi:hypothetical protein